jgi:hypothetical protein
MNKKLTTILMVITAFMAISFKPDNPTYRNISLQDLKDKIAGGWAGKMMGVTYGAPTEFKAQSKTFDGPINWKPADVLSSMGQDDIYVQLTFLMSMDQFGINAPAKKFQEMFAKAGYHLWHANVQARKNYYDSIFPPASGSPEYNIHADDIDFQIEADYIGFMCPGMPQTAGKIASKIGHIMNYGDGVYGGAFVASLYVEAYFENNIEKVIEKALLSIPAKSDYARIIRDVIKLHKHYPSDWKAAWKEIQNKWGNGHICGAGSTFNIDAKFNGAYIVMGLLYGEGDPVKTMEITTRCGQDSDCNPSNAMAVLGVIKGFKNLPMEAQKAVRNVGDSIFSNTNYSFNKAVESTFEYAKSLIKENGGTIDSKEAKVKLQVPKASDLEVSFPNLIFVKKISVFDSSVIITKGNWNTFKYKDWGDNEPKVQSKCAEKAGDEIAFSFEGTGISLMGNWFKNGGKADIYLDGKLHRSIDTYFGYNGQEHTAMSLWHAFNLQPGKHMVRVVVKGDKRPESLGTKIYITEAQVFKTGNKEDQNSLLSFEK